MQMVKEDDYGCVAVDEFFQLLVQLSVDALHNAMIENDVRRLRLHLLRVVRDECADFFARYPDEAQVPIWSLWQVLLKADQILLSRSRHDFFSMSRPFVSSLSIRKPRNMREKLTPFSTFHEAHWAPFDSFHFSRAFISSLLH